jgi:hypothetical protein
MKEDGEVEKSFYIIWILGHGAPTMKHFSPSVVRDEAERLSKKHIGDKVYICYCNEFKVSTAVTTTVALPI